VGVWTVESVVCTTDAGDCMETLGVPNVAVVVLGIPGVDDDIVTDTVVKSASVVI
jgi:hypothetical protein